MNHLPLPPSTPPFLHVPYEAPPETWYEHGPGAFHSFPARRNWNDSQLHGGTDVTKDASDDPNGFHAKGRPEQVEQFFQTWLFFGLLIEFLNLGGVSVSTEDFLSAHERRGKARIVDTASLPGLLVTWTEGIKRRGRLGEDWDTLEGMFHVVGEILDRFCSPDHESEHESYPLDQSKPRPWPVRDDISTSMIALASTLRQTAIKVCDVAASLGPETAGLPWPLHARSRILTRRLTGKWCVADVTTTLKQLSIDGVYYLSASEGLDPTELDHHVRCIPSQCLYEYDLEMYVTRHAVQTPGHTCPESIAYGGQLGPERGQRDWNDAVGRILKKGAVPIALWNKGMQKLWSVEWHFEGKRKPDYVAVSHVWADGKGNPNSNNLPQCQLDLIQRLVEKVPWEGRKPIPSDPNHSDGIGFWMDTLCLPVWDKALRDNAIASMRHVYSNAKAVLVLDDWLQVMRSDADPLDVITRVYQSNWIKRLWTHQEGFLPKALYFQFADRCVEIYELHDNLQAHVSRLQDAGVYLSFPGEAGMRLVTQYTFLEHAFKSATDPSRKWTLYKPLSAAMSERKTSRLADEIICLATIVDIPLRDFLAIPSKPDAQSGQERMEKFLLKLGRFDTGVIFNNYPRLETRGYRWAPRSLLNFRTGRITYWGRDGDTNTEVSASFGPESWDSQLGLQVHYRGFIIQFPNGRPSFAGPERGCAIKCTHTTDPNDRHSAQGKWFIVQLPRDNNNNNTSAHWPSSRTYAVIISEIPREGEGRKSPAVVAAVESGEIAGGGNGSGKATFVVEHLSIATVWVLDQPGWMECDTLRAELLGRRTGWLVL
ncbi:uncharacterized protein BDV17DRAFT_272106 [Aspergillus undulatus]|uniref:uncharacterized protein n=1 Tax=Aspergillus undulatus TaxID=1810928 RepID=UPI003CCD1214